MGLKGTDDEINEAFTSVDADGSGIVDIDEFKTAIKSERMMELNLRNVLDKMGVQMNNLGGRYDQFKATEQRRRLMKKEYEDKLNKKTKEIIQRLAKVSDREIAAPDPEGEKMYNTLRDVIFLNF